MADEIIGKDNITYLCARCGKPLGETAVFDPRGVSEKPSYMHPSCGAIEKAGIAVELKLAGPALFEALQKIVHAGELSLATGDPDQWLAEIPRKLIRQARRVLNSTKEM